MVEFEQRCCFTVAINIVVQLVVPNHTIVIKEDIIDAAIGIEVVHYAIEMVYHSFIMEAVAVGLDQSGSIVNVIRLELMVLNSAVDNFECYYLGHKLVQAIDIVVITGTIIDSFDIDPKQVLVLMGLHYHMDFITTILKLLRQAFMLLVTYLNSYC